MDLWKGKRVIWRHTPRGGYGYTFRIPVTVVKVGKCIRIALEDGREVTVPRERIIDPPTMRGVTVTAERPDATPPAGSPSTSNR